MSRKSPSFLHDIPRVGPYALIDTHKFDIENIFFKY